VPNIALPGDAIRADIALTPTRVRFAQ